MPKDTLSKRIRDIERLLQLDTLPETTRNEKERALASLRSEKQSGARKREEARMIQKYKMVKFIEHQKGVRRLAQAKKRCKALSADATESERQEAQENLRKREVDIRYIENFPIMEKYISLYKPVEGPGAHRTKDRRDEIWKLAESGSLRASGDQSTRSKKAVREKDAVELETAEDEKDDFFE